MNNHFTITINDDNGVKQFNLHKIIKKAIFYAVLFIVTIALIAIGTILYLNYTVDEIETKHESVQKAYLAQKEKNRLLDESMQETQMALVDKKRELMEVSDTLSEIETLIGIAPVADMSLQERVSMTKLNSEHMATLMQFIPSGSPIKYSGVTSGLATGYTPL